MRFFTTKTTFLRRNKPEKRENILKKEVGTLEKVCWYT